MFLGSVSLLSYFQKQFSVMGVRKSLNNGSIRATARSFRLRFVRRSEELITHIIIIVLPKEEKRGDELRCCWHLVAHLVTGTHSTAHSTWYYY